MFEFDAGGGEDHVSGDVDGVPLAGAEYRLLREVTEDESRQPETQPQWFRVRGSWKRLTSVEQPDSTVVTGSDGTAVFEDLEAGTYYIQELSPPAGFDAQTELIEARVQLSGASGPAILVETTKTAENDQTRMGMLLAAAFLAVVSSSAALLLLNVRSKGF